MIELDNDVMIGCSKYMRSVCGDYLAEENRKGTNYEVICGDALEYMEYAIVSRQKQLSNNSSSIFTKIRIQFMQQI